MRWYPHTGLFDRITYEGGVGDAKIIAQNHVYTLSDGDLTRRASVIVRRGYVFNGANLPRFLWFWFGHPFESPRDRAALLHDALYDEKPITRAEADALYRVCLAELGYNAAHRWIEWLFIRAFGWIAWRRSRPSQYLRANISGG